MTDHDSFALGIARKESAKAREAPRHNDDHTRRQAGWLQPVLDTTPAIIWIAHDRECRSITGNRAAYEFSRVALGDDLSKTGPQADRLAHYRMFHASKELAPHEMPIQRVAASGAPLLDYEVDFVFADGTARTLVGNVNPVFDGAGNTAGAVAAFIDITQRKRAENELYASEKRYRSLAELSPDAIVVHRNGRYVYANAAALALYGARHPGELIGKTMLERVHPDYRATVTRRIDAIYGEHSSARPIELKHMRLDGETIDVDVTATLISYQGEAAILAVIRDITARKQAEEQLRELSQRLTYHVDHSPLAVIEWGPDMRLTRWSNAAEHLFGWKAEEVLGKRMEDFRWIYDEDQAQVAEVSADLRSGEKPRRFSRNRNYCKDGSVVWCEWYNSSLTDECGTLRSILSLVLDVTARKQAAESLTRANEQLREADRRKDEFLAMLAHELRNPLAPIRTGVHILRTAGADTPGQPILPMMERQLQQLTRLLDDLLDVSRITRGKFVLTKAPIELARMVHAAVEASEPLITAMNHRLTIKLPGEPVMVDGDAVRLAQVFSNLLNNAAKFTPSGGHIELCATRSEEEATISVKDNGAGIPSGELSRIFDMFSQVEDDSSRFHAGLGIGLALVQGIIELHGGTVEARSDGPGRGSEFVVRLPALETRKVASLEHGDEAPGITTLKILVVDDNKDAADSLSMLLQMLGNDVRVAHCGENALALSHEFEPSVVLLDLGMPGMDGYEVCQRLRETQQGAALHVIAVSGWGQDEDRRKSEAAGFDAHLVKPVDLSALTKLLLKMSEP